MLRGPWFGLQIEGLPATPAAYKYGQLSMYYVLRWGVVSCCFRALGCDGGYKVRECLQRAGFRFEGVSEVQM